AKLYGFGAGEGANIFVPSAAAAFQWIFDNADNPCAPDPADPVACPPITVVNNSWGGSGAHNPDLAISKLSDALVGEGITVVFAAGNSDGDGTTINTNPYGNNDTEGVISVANYFDDDEGNRNAALDSSSSRGKSDQPETWPDVSAPGTLITSTCRPTKPVCNLPIGVPSPAYSPNYTILAGTSMAAPHTAGIISLLYQADPSITPAQVEDVLEDNAHKFTAGAPYQNDPANPDDTSSFDKGHGLVDARLSALEVLGLPTDYSNDPAGAVSSPSVSIDSPAEGEKVKRLFTAAGSATTGGGSTITTVIASGDGGDYAANDSQDLVEARLTENVVSDTVTVEWQVRGTTTAPSPGTSFRYWLFTSIDGVARRLGVTWTGVTTTISDESPAACSAAKADSVFSLTCPAASLGATEGAVLFDAFAATFRTPGLVFGGITKGSGTEDVAPGGLGATALSLPERGEEHVFVGQSIDPPTGRVTLSVDGDAQRTVGTGLGPFTWSSHVGPVSPGTHTLTARLFIDGASTPAATDSITVFKARD
ncbi:MAG: S8 family serine peptidase, partial [Actinomycetota bacterium]|nr:S8 family serine peptidase [Actinomycetota bacterium]